jgi:hypothetical protein
MTSHAMVARCRSRDVDPYRRPPNPNALEPAATSARHIIPGRFIIRFFVLAHSYTMCLVGCMRLCKTLQMQKIRQLHVFGCLDVSLGQARLVQNIGLSQARGIRPKGAFHASQATLGHHRALLTLELSSH